MLQVILSQASISLWLTLSVSIVSSHSLFHLSHCVCGCMCVYVCVSRHSVFSSSCSLLVLSVSTRHRFSSFYVASFSQCTFRYGVCRCMSEVWLYVGACGRVWMYACVFLIILSSHRHSLFSFFVSMCSSSFLVILCCIFLTVYVQVWCMWVYVGVCRCMWVYVCTFLIILSLVVLFHVCMLVNLSHHSLVILSSFYDVLLSMCMWVYTYIYIYIYIYMYRCMWVYVGVCVFLVILSSLSHIFLSRSLSLCLCARHCRSLISTIILCPIRVHFVCLVCVCVCVCVLLVMLVIRSYLVIISQNYITTPEIPY